MAERRRVARAAVVLVHRRYVHLQADVTTEHRRVAAATVLGAERRL